MDARAVEAVKAAINKARVCKKPIAGYDKENKKAYIEYANGQYRISIKAVTEGAFCSG